MHPDETPPAGPLDGRVAIVTGGARGIGAATVRGLLDQGARVCVADLDADSVEGLAGTDTRVVRVACDLARPAAAGEVVDAACTAFGGFDIVVNNAGYYWDSPLHRMSDEQFEAMLQIHTVVPFRMIRTALREWRPLAKCEQREGTPRYRKIVNVSSRAATKGLAGAANYAAGKAGLLGLTYSAAKEAAHLNVNVNAVSFGPVATRFGRTLTDGAVVRSGGHEVPLGRPDRPARADGPAGGGSAKPRRSTLSGRSASAEEAAQTIVFLCSPSANLLNGEVITVNG